MQQKCFIILVTFLSPKHTREKSQLILPVERSGSPLIIIPRFFLSSDCDDDAASMFPSFRESGFWLVLLLLKESKISYSNWESGNIFYVYIYI